MGGPSREAGRAGGAGRGGEMEAGRGGGGQRKRMPCSTMVRSRKRKSSSVMEAARRSPRSSAPSRLGVASVALTFSLNASSVSGCGAGRGGGAAQLDAVKATALGPRGYHRKKEKMGCCG